MNFDLVILDGPEAGRRLPVQTVPVTLGRAPAAALAFPDDGFISSVHLSVQSDPEGVRITDLRSTNGTFLNGERINSALANVGDVIQIGTMTLQVAQSQGKPAPVSAPIFSTPTTTPASPPSDATFIGSPSLPRMDIPAPPPVAPIIGSTTTIPRISVDGSEQFKRLDADPGPQEPEPQAKLKKKIASLSDPVFVMVNAGVDPAIPSLLSVNFVDVARSCMWQEQAGADASWAPHLVETAPDSQLMNSLIDRGWGNGWVSVFTSTASTDELLAHFGKFLKVQMEQTGSIYFRFYEPKVFREFLSTASPTETSIFFGPVRKWFLEGESKDSLTQATNDTDGLTIQTVSLMDVTVL